MLFSAGNHVPVMPLVDVVGNAAKAAPEHIGAMGLNVGVVGGVTVMVKVEGVAHWPVVGVNV